MNQFKDKHYVVTGGSSGIGLAIARSLSNRGAEVCIVGRRHEALHEAVSDLGGGSWSIQCDVGDEQQVETLAEAVGRRWSALDGLVNNAGVAPMADLENTEPEVWDQCFRVNARGPYLMTRALLGLLRAAESSSIVNISSTLAEKAIPGMVAYNSAKAALNQMTRSIALELAPKIRVNAIMPAVVDTPIHASRGMSSGQVKGMGRIHPLNRVGQPEDIAEMTVYLLSDAASWMTGAIVPVDGGMMAT
ncbi:MAG: SDR family oxidoreductase [Acidobacteria bacterium]|nr:SDR family oxidoreductase [Acidobacteriota bacterium]